MKKDLFIISSLLLCACSANSQFSRSDLNVYDKYIANQALARVESIELNASWGFRTLDDNHYLFSVQNNKSYLVSVEEGCNNIGLSKRIEGPPLSHSDTAPHDHAMATLRVTLLRARDLAASDAALEGSKSDPFVVFRVGNDVQQSSCLAQTLDPEWRPRERFDFLVARADRDVLRGDVFDYDAFSAHDLLGSLVLPVAKFAQHANVPQHEVYHLDVPDAVAAQQGASTIELEVCFVEGGHDGGGGTLRMWENEVWSLTAGWVASDTEVYRRYSSFDDAVTSNRFDAAAPRVPDGMEGDGWHYVADAHRGDGGWVYAYNFLGPFAAEKTLTSYVRRRLWENKCAPRKETSE